LLIEPAPSKAHAEQEDRRARDERSESPRGRAQRFVEEVHGGRFLDRSVDTQFSDAWVAVTLLIGMLGLALSNHFLLGLSVTVAVITLVGKLWNELSLFGVHYERKLSETRAFLGETVQLTLEMRNNKFLPVTWLQVVDIVPATLPLERVEVRLNRSTNLGEITSFWSLGAFQRLTRRFEVQCTERGYHHYGPAKLRSGDGFGMFSRSGTLSHRQSLIVYPRIYSVAELRLPAKNPFGHQVASQPLLEDQLRNAGIREWQSSDGMKRVHWKATARQGVLLSRLYEASEEPQVLIFLNVATLERHWLGNIPELLERAISVAGSLASLATELRLPVGLIANGFLPGSDQPLRLLPGRSPDQLTHIMELLAAVTAFATVPIERLIAAESPRLPWGATVVAVSAIAHDGLLATLQALADAGRRVVLFTLAEQPPELVAARLTVYHLPHLVEDLIEPRMVSGCS
jgi:uncharacterized protein (DUF58 family)